MNRRPCTLVRCLVAFTLVTGVLAVDSICLATEIDSQCPAVRNRWESIMQSLKDRLQELEEIQRTPLQKVIRRPLLENNSGAKTIARQISDAIQAKEQLLAAKREECRNILSEENQVYSEFEQCLRQSPAAKKDDRLAKKIEKQRRQLVDKAQIAVVEVRAVEGQNTGIPYSQAYQGPFRRDESYWNNYQQMYRGYWGQ